MQQSTDIDRPIFEPPDTYTHTQERMLSQLNEVLTAIQNDVEVMKLAMVQIAKRLEREADDGR